MLEGVILMWFILTGLAVLFVITDIHNTPQSGVLKWPLCSSLPLLGRSAPYPYVLGCREPLPGLHKEYVKARWRQVLGSTLHCVAGDGIGILVGAVIGALSILSPRTDLAVEYILGFAFGWGVFQALFMRDMSGGVKGGVKGSH